ncbi:hypothetical protein GF323_02410 [Candidatus Woesearchaeota archaeon]|nr:hypothetical protein [Candidatus Woesearchaeota archaeon]
MKMKSLFVLGIMLLGILAFGGITSALRIDVPTVKVELDDEVLDEKGTTNIIESLEKGDELEVEVKFDALEDIDDVQVEAMLRGYDHDDLIEDITDVFDVKGNRSYKKRLTLEFPRRMDQDEYSLRVIISSRNDAELFEYDLGVETGRHIVAIRDVVLSPANGVKAGRALLATVRVQNYGSGDEDDVKVTFSIPELGIAASDYIDELEADGEDDDSKSTEELYLRIPIDTDAGEYDAEVEVQYHDREKTVSKEMTVTVFADETFEEDMDEDKAEGKTVISIGPESQDVTKGAGGVIYPVTITNTGKAKTYTVSVTGGDWGSFRVSPSNVITVGQDQTKTAYIYAAANADAPTGEQVFGVEIAVGDEAVKQVTLSANVVGGGAGTGTNLKRALEIGLIVLVVILVILGLIIGFNKLKGEEEKEEGESYY